MHKDNAGRDRMCAIDLCRKVARIGLMLLVLVAVHVFWHNAALTSRLAAQDEATLDEPLVGGEPAAADAPVETSGTAGGAPEKSRTLFDMLLASGIIGLIICLLSLVAVAFMIEHALTIRKSKLMPEHVLVELDQMIARGEIDQAIEYCQHPEHHSLASDVILAGLERFKGSEFGFAEYKTAVEEAGEDHTGRLYRKTEVLGVIGAIAPMLGLLGTVQGMISAFNTIASKGGMARPDELAGGISLALITTFEGLVVAIPAMVAFSFFRNKIDSLVAEAGKHVERVMMPLGRKRG
jgi:biopolymer transport protein ExbB